MAKASYSVLLVDDSPDDRLFVRLALRGHPKLRIAAEVSDGDEAIDYLTGTPPYNDREKFPFPDVVLLDLKMPRKTGFDVLKWLRARSFKDLAVIVISGSFLPQDISESLALGATAYHRKATLKAERDDLFREIEASFADTPEEIPHAFFHRG